MQKPLDSVHWSASSSPSSPYGRGALAVPTCCSRYYGTESRAYDRRKKKFKRLGLNQKERPGSRLPSSGAGVAASGRSQSPATHVTPQQHIACTLIFEYHAPPYLPTIVPHTLHSTSTLQEPRAHPTNKFPYHQHHQYLQNACYQRKEDNAGKPCLHRLMTSKVSLKDNADASQLDQSV